MIVMLIFSSNTCNADLQTKHIVICILISHGEYIGTDIQ
jgi:hypothetical protein